MKAWSTPSQSRQPTRFTMRASAIPPKAVFGLAASEHLGLQLGPSDFSAGEGQPCFRVLRDLGVEILPLQGEASTEGRKTWALLCNPDVFDAEGAAAVLDEGLWALPKGDPEPGDRLLIWKAKGGAAPWSGGSWRGRARALEVKKPDEQSHAGLSARTWPAEESRRFRLRYIPLPAGPLLGLAMTLATSWPNSRSHAVKETSCTLFREGTRTLDIQLGKLTLYQLSYSRSRGAELRSGALGAQGAERGSWGASAQPCSPRHPRQ